jgi:hypothetical protein
MEKYDKPDPNAPAGSLIPYYLTPDKGNNKCPTYYNDVRHVGPPPQVNPYKITGVPTVYVLTC